MKTMILLTAFFALQASAADDCFYCGKIDEIKGGFAQVKPDPMDVKTSERQMALVDQSITVAEEVLEKRGKDLKNDDIERLVSLLAIATPYDNANMIGESLLKPARPYLDRFSVEVKKQESKGLIKPSVAKLMESNFLVADALEKGGNDRDEEDTPEKMPAKKADAHDAKKADPKKKK